VATVGHIAAGLAMCRAGGRGADAVALVVVTTASVAPDLDLLIGINHRGPSHSIGFTALVGAAAWIGLTLWRHPAPGTVALLAMGGVLTHIGLDLMTAHSPIALLWPISQAEFVLDVTLLPSAPTDESLLSRAGLLAAAAEVAWSVALVWAAGLRIRRTAASDATSRQSG
jgi:membrane-bound metal-dependent hydrolase YbcI (DUF457 family)